LPGWHPLPSGRCERGAPVARDPISLDADRRCTGSHHLRRDHDKTGLHEPRKHFAPKPVGKHQGFLELLSFPNGRHDDQVDSVSQFLRWFQNDAYNQLSFAAPIIFSRPREFPFEVYGGPVNWDNR
jgi:hypothetical protein